MDLNECKQCGTVGWTLDELKTGKCPHCRALENDDTCENNALLPDVSGSTDDEDEVYYTECPNCERPYDEIDSDFCICSKCGWDANEHRFKSDAKRNPSDLDYLNGDADILSGEWV